MTVDADGDATVLRGLIRGGTAGEAATATGRRISSQIALQLGGRAIGIAVALVTVPLMARTLEPEGLGVYTAGLAFVGIFGSFTGLGLTTAAMQRMAADPEREGTWLSAMVGLRLTLSVVATVLCIASIPLLLGTEDDVHLVALVLALTIILGAAGSATAVFQTRLRAGLPQALTVVQNLLWLGTVVAIAALSGDALDFAIGFVGVSVVLAAMQVVAVRRYVRLTWREGRELWRPLVRLAIPLGISSVMIVLYYRIDALLLLKLAGAEEAGVYAAAYRFLDPLLTVPGIIMVTFFPVLSALHERDPARTRMLVQRCAEAMFVVTLPLFALTLALSEPIVDLLFGEAYARSAGLLPILMAAFVSIGFGTLAGVLAPVLGLQWRLALYSTLGALANVGLNLVLIPPYGAYGSASATLATEVLTMTLMFSTALRALKMRLAVGRLAGALGAAAGAWAAAAALRPLGLVTALVGGGLAYVVLLFALRVVRPDELRALRAR